MKKKAIAILYCSSVLFMACGDNGSKSADPGFTRGTTTDAQGKPDGQALFVQNCAACHQVDKESVGPALKGALERWGGDKGRMYSFIKNNQEVIAKGDARAVEVKKKYGGSMPAFPQLTDADIDAIMKYIGE